MSGMLRGASQRPDKYAHLLRAPDLSGSLKNLEILKHEEIGLSIPITI
jgi:hypothetical protein